MDCGEFFPPHSRKERIEYDAWWRKHNRPRIKATAQRYYQKHRVKILAKLQARRKAERE